MIEKLSQLPAKPGVYRFLNAAQKIIYVGKAKDLKKRVSQYFRKNISDKKTNALMEQAVDFEITITENENQALLLESNLIKAHHPKYNILLRDDKAYPYLFLSTQDDFPRLDYYRGNLSRSSAAVNHKGRYFGPYPNAGSVRENLALIQKLFKLRQCSDVFFQHRSRPCLQYQINRCTAPCVNYVSSKNYQQQVKDAVHFLEGKNRDVMESVEERMEDASKHMDYELAVHFRDLLIRLRKLQSQQFVTGGKGNFDIFGFDEKMGHIAIAVVTIRNGQLLGHKTFFLALPSDMPLEEALSQFLPQYYLNPIRAADKIDAIILSHLVADRAWIESALQETLQSKIKIVDEKNRKTEAFREWQAIAMTNAKQALKQQLTEKNNIAIKLELLQKALNLPSIPARIECFDISHTQGEATKASCVVFGSEGAIRKAYRQFNIENITPGDDYAAMKQVLTRRYTQLKTDNKKLPDLIIIDGGKGQLKIAATVLESLQVSGVFLMGVAKGPARKPGMEKIFLWGKEDETHLSADNPALHLIQFIRDEAHRFAITAHRKMRGKNRLQSKLDTITGVGKKRKSELLKFFGGLQELKKASAEEISKIKGISRVVAKHIYAVLHEDE